MAKTQVLDSEQLPTLIIIIDLKLEVWFFDAMLLLRFFENTTGSIDAQNELTGEHKSGFSFSLKKNLQILVFCKSGHIKTLPNDILKV